MKSESRKEKPSSTGPFWTSEGYRIVRHSCININLSLKSIHSLSFKTETGEKWGKEIEYDMKMAPSHVKVISFF